MEPGRAREVSSRYDVGYERHDDLRWPHRRAFARFAHRGDLEASKEIAAGHSLLLSEIEGFDSRALGLRIEAGILHPFFGLLPSTMLAGARLSTSKRASS